MTTGHQGPRIPADPEQSAPYGGPAKLQGAVDLLGRHPGPPGHHGQHKPPTPRRNNPQWTEGPQAWELRGNSDHQGELPFTGRSWEATAYVDPQFDPYPGQGIQHSRLRPRMGEPPRTKMATFEATERDDWDAFYSAFERLARHLQWSPLEKLDRLHESLRGAAAKFVGLLPERVKEDYALLVGELKGRFCWREPASTTRQRLADLQQGNRSLAEHAEEVRPLVVRAYPDATLQARDQYTAEAFAQGLRNRQVAFLMLQPAPTTLTDATVYVDTCKHNYRATMRDERPKARTRRVSWVDEDEGWSSGSEGGCVRHAATPPHTAASKRDQPHTSSAERSRAWEAEADAKFAKLSSLLAEVLRKGMAPDRQRSPSPAPQQEKAPGCKPRGPCYACGEEGHFRRECSRSPSPGRPKEEDSGNE